MSYHSEYYIWLRGLTGDNPNYQSLICQLDTTPYKWAFVLDENRAAGGKNLRAKYAFETSTNEEDVRVGPCSVLEMLIGVASHMQDILNYDISKWFWTLIRNLGLDVFPDYAYDSSSVGFIIERWLSRNYRSDGVGSIFPLRDYPGDCRNLDVWSQMNAWINENYPQDDCWLD